MALDGLYLGIRCSAEIDVLLISEIQRLRRNFWYQEIALIMTSLLLSSDVLYSYKYAR